MGVESYKTPCSVAESCDTCPLRELREDAQEVDTYRMAMSGDVIKQIIEFKRAGEAAPRGIPHPDSGMTIPITGIDQMMACADKIMAGECQLPDQASSIT